MTIADLSWVNFMHTLDAPPLWLLGLALAHVALVLLVFKLLSNDWLGRKGHKK